MTAEEFIAVDPCSSAPRLTPRRWAWLGFALWLPVVGGGMFWMAGYANRAGARGSAGPEVVAVESAPQSSYRLRMFAHPHCPCTAASLNELARIVARSESRLATTVCFYRPNDAADDWIDGKLRAATAAIPGVEIQVDPAGEIAERFGARVSGEVVLSDASGRVRYRGGITAGRGHEGDNRGESWVSAVVLGDEENVGSSPVFGCELFADTPAGAR